MASPSEALALVTVQLPFAPENDVLIDRIIEVTVLFTTIHVLIHLAPPAESGLFATNFWQMLLFAAIGFGVYYLVIKKLVRFQCVGSSLTLPGGDILHNIRQKLKELL